MKRLLALAVVCVALVGCKSQDQIDYDRGYERGVIREGLETKFADNPKYVEGFKVGVAQYERAADIQWDIYHPKKQKAEASK